MSMSRYQSKGEVRVAPTPVINLSGRRRNGKIGGHFGWFAIAIGVFGSSRTDSVQSKLNASK